MSKGTATKGLRSAHAKSIKGLAWASFVVALADGALLPGTFVGDWVRTAFGILPNTWSVVVPVIVLIVGWVAVFLDCYLDLEPNQVAIYGALLLPTVASTISGGLADWVRSVADTVLHAIDQWLFQAAPDGLGSSALALAAAVAVLLMANRVVKKSRKG
jgi:fructose-specific phosphotransferase system IIC component